MPRALFAFLLLPLMLAMGCSSGRTSAPEPTQESAAATDTSEIPETTAMDTASDKAAPQDCTYTTTPLTDATQVQINCSNGTGFVVRQRADGKWEQEARAVAGARPTYASLEQAAKALCCR